MRYLQSMLVNGVNSNSIWWSSGCFLGSDYGNGVRGTGRSNFVLGNNSQVISGGWLQVENSGYVLLRSWYEYSVDVNIPGALADLVFDDVTFDVAVSVVWCCPG